MGSSTQLYCASVTTTLPNPNTSKTKVQRAPHTDQGAVRRFDSHTALESVGGTLPHRGDGPSAQAGGPELGSNPGWDGSPSYPPIGEAEGSHLSCYACPGGRNPSDISLAMMEGSGPHGAGV